MNTLLYKGLVNSTGFKSVLLNTHTHSSYLHLLSFMLKGPSSCGRSWPHEAESWCFLSARWRRGRTLWRNRSFLSFTCRKSHRPRYGVKYSWPVIPFVLGSRKIVCLLRQSLVLTRSTEDPKEYFRLTLHPVSTSDIHNTQVNSNIHLLQLVLIVIPNTHSPTCLTSPCAINQIIKKVITKALCHTKWRANKIETLKLSI